MKTINKRANQYTCIKKDFKASNLVGYHKGNLYIVESYGWWPLFVYSYTTERWYTNIDKYSVSTSKQRTQAHPRCDMIELSHESIKELIELGSVS